MQQGLDLKLDDAVPAEDRQLYLRQAERTNVAAGKDPFEGVSIRTRGEVLWILQEHNWSGDVDSYMKTRANLRGADLFGTVLRGIVLVGADLAGSYCERADFSGADLRQANLRGTNFVAASLAGCMLIEADLTASIMDLCTLDDSNLAGAILAGASLVGAHLNHAYLFLANLDRTILNDVQLTSAVLAQSRLTYSRLAGAELSSATLTDADMTGAVLDRSILTSAQLKGANLEDVSALFTNFRDSIATGANFAGANFTLGDFRGADLRSCRMDSSTILDQVKLADVGNSSLLADVRWNGVDVTVIDWSKVRTLGDDRRKIDKTIAPKSILKDPAVDKSTRRRLAARRKQEKEDALLAAVRANRQVATQLSSQGLNEDANRFSYRAQILQRKVLRHQGKYGQYLFSLFLDVLAGYGYLPVRSLIAYISVVTLYALAYFTGSAAAGHQLQWYAALVISLTAFHGRGFFPTELMPADPLAVLAATEAVLGLVIEISFIATFTQRFFGK